MRSAQACGTVEGHQRHLRSTLLASDSQLPLGVASLPSAPKKDQGYTANSSALVLASVHLTGSANTLVVQEEEHD